MKKLMAAALCCLVGAGANAAVIAYDLEDHPDRAVAGEDYGIRLDSASTFWSFDGASDAELRIDTDLNVAVIVGTVIESPLSGAAAVWNIVYRMEDITILDAAKGFFTATAGLGFITDGTTTHDIESLPNGAGIALEFDGDGHRLPGDNTSEVGRGWIDAAGVNDFLFTATELGSPGGGFPEVPLPAGGLLLIGGLGVLAAAKRKKKA